MKPPLLSYVGLEAQHDFILGARSIKPVKIFAGKWLLTGLKTQQHEFSTDQASAACLGLLSNHQQWEVHCKAPVIFCMFQSREARGQ